MRKKIMRRLFVFALYWLSPFVFGATSDHLEELKSRFPHGLLTDDHGILKTNDLAVNASDVQPEPFTPASHVYQYWQCFESNRISFDCDSNGDPDEHEGIMGLVVVKASTLQVQNEYIERRLWPIRECKNFIKSAALLLKGTQYACISGSFIGNERNRSGHPSMNWVFERIKTKKGCEGRGCDFTKKLK